LFSGFQAGRQQPISGARMVSTNFARLIDMMPGEAWRPCEARDARANMGLLRRAQIQTRAKQSRSG
jgi:hypothetical protein